MKTFLTLICALLLSLASICQSGPELVFQNPVLVSGQANKQGAVYRFSNITPGVDATIKLKKFSRSSIVMNSIDNASTGWAKAFQPEFGLPGLILPLQNWYIDFELTFYQAGTNNVRTVDTVDLTALDVDGDGNSISEYVTYDQPTSILYSTVNFLSSTASGVLGQVFECGEDGISSILVSCSNCGGDGITNSGSGNNNECQNCDGSGKLHDQCDHAFQGGTGSTVLGPVNNFLGIDTSATQVMATYQFLNKSKIKFRYGAKSGLLSSNGSGIRLNSTWFREFALTPLSTLPVKIETFTATLNNNKADLKWTTASEINVSHFVIEKSLDGKNFIEAGMMFAYGNAGTKSNYAFADNVSKNSGVIYYRLRSDDIDGKSQYSQTRVIHIGKQESNAISILTYPNPAMNELQITIPASWQNKKVTYELYTANGTSASQAVIANASQTQTMNISRLAPGFYMVRVTCDGEVAKQKIVKQ